MLHVLPVDGATVERLTCLSAKLLERKNASIPTCCHNLVRKSASSCVSLGESHYLFSHFLIKLGIRHHNSLAVV